MDRISYLIKKLKNPIIFIPVLVIIISIIVAGLLYFKVKPPQFISSNTIDLTSGKITDLKDNLGPYIEQSTEICDQNNLNNAFFKSFFLPDNSVEASQSGVISVYGENTRNFTLQGEISNIQTVTGGVKYTLTNGENTLITQTTNNTISWGKNSVATTSSDLVPIKADASTVAIKDRAYLYYLVKCGGNRPPLLFLQYIQKSNTASKSAEIQSYIPSKDITTDKGGTFFVGEVIDKENSFLNLKGEKTIKIYVDKNIFFIETPKVLPLPFNNFLNTKPNKVDYASIKKGDLLSVTITIKNSQPTAEGGLIFK